MPPRAWLMVRVKWLLFATLATGCSSLPAAGPLDELVKRVGTDSQAGIAQAVMVQSAVLLHTRQLLPREPAARALDGKPAPSEVEDVWQQLTTLLREEATTPAQLVKLNVYVVNETVAADVRRFLSEKLKNQPAVAVSFVQSRLPQRHATLGIDAVAAIVPGAFSGKPPSNSEWQPIARLPSDLPRLYVSGQAEKGTDLSEATRKTLASLQNTLKQLGSDLPAVAQVKCFLKPMSKVAAVQRELVAFFGKRVPPCVFVEWESTLPIEIELVASGWPKSDSTKPLEFITPPGMTSSPVFCRVVRVNDPRTIFVSGLFAREAGDGAAQVNDVFAQLQEILKASGSDLRHLAKATYYVSDNDASAKLNELRPKFYDPQRPPAASKAQVFGVGMSNRSLTLDMIAVPTK